MGKQGVAPGADEKRLTGGVGVGGGSGGGGADISSSCGVQGGGVGGTGGGGVVLRHKTNQSERSCAPLRTSQTRCSRRNAATGQGLVSGTWLKLGMNKATEEMHIERIVHNADCARVHQQLSDADAGAAISTISDRGMSRFRCGR